MERYQLKAEGTSRWLSGIAVFACSTQSLLLGRARQEVDSAIDSVSRKKDDIQQTGYELVNEVA